MKKETKVNVKKNKKSNSKIKQILLKHRKFFVMLILACILIYILQLMIQLFQNPTDTFLVEQGKIYQEESAVGYIIRDETVIKGENYKNGMSQIKTEGERVAKGEPIFRYYSNGEENLIKKIQELDEKIDVAMEGEKELKELYPGDIKALEDQITDRLDMIYQESDLIKIQEYKKDINNYITKKAKIAGEYSPVGSYLKKLVDERKEYENKLNEGAEYLESPISGMVSYRVDGYEEILKPGDFKYITKDFLEGLNLKTGQIIAANEESGKVIDNYECYIATAIRTKYAKDAKIGTRVKLRLPSGNEIPAEIAYIADEGNNQYVIVFEIERCVEELISYRKISFQIIWWSDTGKKIPNSAIVTEQKGDKQVSYVIRLRAGYQDKILIQVLRSNERYSIVKNYTTEDLEELGYTSNDDVYKRRLTLYDEILKSP